MMIEMVLASRPQAFLVALLAVLTLAFFAEWLLRKKAGLSISTSLGLTMALCFGGVALLMLPGPVPQDAGTPDSWLLDLRNKGYVERDASFWEEFVSVTLQGNLLKWVLLYIRGLFGASIVMLGIPLLITLYQKWFAGMTSPTERQPGRAGIRAWFAESNRTAAAMIMVGLWLWADISLAVSFTLWMFLLAAFPVVLWVRSEQDTETDDLAEPEPATLEPDKDRIFRLIEAGIISGAEGAALLQAVAIQKPLKSRAVENFRFNRSRKIVAWGAVLVLVGFFLPWMKVNLAEEYQRIFTAATQNKLVSVRASGLDTQEMQITKMLGKMNNMGLEAHQWSQAGKALDKDIKLRGSDFTSGWLFLALIAVVVSIHLLPTELSRNTKNMIFVLCGASAGVALAYTATLGITYLALGFTLAVIGLVLVAIGATHSIRFKSEEA